jgi:SAM-dependent methyltransferase
VRHGLMLDNSEAMLTLARRRLVAAGLQEAWKVQRGNAFDLAELQRQFDFIYTFRFIRHFQLEERVRLYSNIWTYLRPGKLLIFDVVNRVVRQQLDARQPQKMEGELAVYDETYTPVIFCQEMKAHGLEVVRLVPVVAHFSLQGWISYRLDRHFPILSDTLVRALEKVASSQPLEWIAVCKKLD